ncbi:MAG: response regulator [Nitrospirae bacterium]|nr:response regulator [Nitrospirota bacterium]MCL5423412.1 response regulator [Nitrospirota bacterium]
MPKKILVIEDDEINRKFFVSLLKEGGYEVVEAADGQTAIELIAKEALSLIFMDIVLPKMSGYEVLKACKEKGLLGSTKVYALTASAESEVGEAGFDGIITKPVRVREFLRTVQEILHVREEEREARRN